MSSALPTLAWAALAAAAPAAAAAAPADPAPIPAPAPPPAAPPEAAPTPAPITERAAVRAAATRNPAFRATVTEVMRASALVQAEGHRYPFTLGVDASAARTQTPSLGAAGDVPEATQYQAGVELGRHLVWGTDLSLRLETSRETAEASTYDVTATPPALRLATLGPGYGALVKLALTHPFLRGSGREVNEAALRQADAAATQAERARLAAASQLVLDVTSAWWELYFASRAVDIERHSLALALAQRDDAAARARTGSLAPADLLGFDTRVAGLREELETALAEERRRSTALGQLTGDRGPHRAAGWDTAEAIPAAPPPPPADAADRAVEGDPELAEQRAAVALAEVAARTATDPLRARLDVSAFVQAQGLGDDDVPAAWEQTGTLRAVTAFVGVTWQAPLDDTRREREQFRAELAVVAARQRLASATQRVLATLDDALTSDASARQRLALADTTLSIARRQVEAEAARFRTGSATALQVREAEDQVRAAELRRLRAAVDLARAHLTVGHLTGRLLREYGTPDGP